MTGIPTEADEAENERHRAKARKHKAARDKIMATKVGEKGLLIVNTGTGKGKTSAALGMVFRHIAGMGHRRGEGAGEIPGTGDAAHHGRRLYLGDAGSRARYRRCHQGLGTRQGTHPRRSPPHGAAGRTQYRAALRLPRPQRRPDVPARGKARRQTCRHHRPQCQAGNDRDGRSRHRNDAGQAPIPRRRERPEGHRILMARPTPALMIQATGSNAGKSTIVAGLARALVRRGLKVAPFKPQNMSNNAAVAIEGGEIGRAQAVQARAARVPPSVHMNPVLLKPETDTGAQIIMQGKRWGTLRAKNYLEKKTALLPAVLESFAYLAREADIILVEGAGSPAEINLRAGDIANMGFAAAANVPVVMLGDIDRGGVIASLAGTHLVLDPDELARIHGFIINKFRGDVGLFDQGLAAITRFTGWPSLGVVPWLPQAAWLPAEDAVDLDRP